MAHGELGLGLDIGGTKTRAVLVTAGQVIDEAVVPTQKGEVGLRSTVTEVTQLLCLGSGVSAMELASVGIGLPGIVDPRSGIVTTSLNLEIERADLNELLADSFGVRVWVENDVKAAALGACYVLGEQVTELCYLNVGTGLSAGVVSGGQIVRGLHNGAGELGHLSVDSRGEPCVCGQRGCLEAVAGGAGVARRLAAIGADLATLPSNPDPRAQTQLRSIVDALAIAVSVVFSAYEPSIVVLGGGVLSNAPWLRPALTEELERRAGQSPFMARFNAVERLIEIPPEVPVAALGAAVVGVRSQPSQCRSYL